MKVVGIEVGFGVSLSVSEKAWLKANAGMKVELDSPSDTTDEAFEKAWTRVVHEVNKQINNFEVGIVPKN